MINEEKIERARTVNLPSFLEFELGLVPASVRGDDRFYYSPFRRESAPSLHVSCRRGLWVWYDHGSVERSGGDAISLLRRLGCSFAEAVEKLAAFNGYVPDKARPAGRMKPSPSARRGGRSDALARKMDKVFFVRSVYARLPAPGGLVRRHFIDRGLAYYPEIGARLFVDFKESVKYMAFPVPFPSAMRGMELREAIPVSMELSSDCRKRRKSYGVKSLWVFRRDRKRMLVTESILDALAGEALFGIEDATLVALNGVGQAREVEALLDSVMKPGEVVVALDNDGPGREASETIRGILSSRRIKTEFPAISEKDPLRELLKKNKDLTCCK